MSKKANSAREKNQEVYPSERVTSFDIKDGDSTIEFNWLGLGCPKEICCRLGDKIFTINFPEGFPEKGIEYHKKGITVYDTQQELHVTSESNRVATNVQLTISTSRIKVPFQIILGGELLLDGFTWIKNGRKPIYDNKGILIGWSVDLDKIRTDFERDVYRGGRCRPDCRWTSIKLWRVEYPWEMLGIVKIFDDGTQAIFRRKVWERWGNYHCEKGNWVQKSEVDDNFVEKKYVWRKKS